MSAGTVCEHCNYERREQEFVPEWQCPRCGNAYGKTGASPAPVKAAPTPDTHAPAGGLRTFSEAHSVETRPRWVWSSGSIGYILIGVALGLLMFFATHALGRKPGHDGGDLVHTAMMSAAGWVMVVEGLRRAWTANITPLTRIQEEWHTKTLKRKAIEIGVGLALMLVFMWLIVLICAP